MESLREGFLPDGVVRRQVNRDLRLRVSPRRAGPQPWYVPASNMVDARQKAAELAAIEEADVEIQVRFKIELVGGWEPVVGDA